MNIHFDNAVDAICRASAILYAIDETFMEEADSRLQRLIYTVWDAVKTADAELELLAGDKMVVDAIYAVNDVRRKAAQSVAE